MKRGSLARLLLLALLGVGLGLSLLPSPARAASGVVRFYLFYAADCSKCQAVKDEFLPPLLQQYGSRVEVSPVEVSDPAAMQQLIGLEEQFGVPADQATVPEVFIGDQALVGEDEIRARLPGLIEAALAAGGLELPALPAAQAAAATPAPVLNKDGKPVVRWILFYSETCPHCHEVMENFLPKVYKKYGDQVEHREIEINQGDNYQTMLGVETKLGVSEDKQGFVPALVIGDQVLVGGADIPDQLEGLIDQYLAQGGVDYVSLENLPAVVPPTPAPTFQAFLFYHPQDPGLAEVQSFIQGLAARYGSHFQVIPFDRTDPEYTNTLSQVLAGYNGPQPGPTDPVLLTGSQILVGPAAIKSQLPGLVTAVLGSGSQATPTPATATPQPEPIHMAYFEKAGCQECARTTYDLKLVQKQYPQLVVETFPIESKQAFNKWLAEKHNVPQEKWLSTPMIFVGSDVLIGTEANARNLLAAVGKYASTGAESTWADFSQEDEQQATGDLKDVFLTWGGWKIATAGLIDGLNPCAFATLVFFISYMAFTGRRGRDILFVGAAFALGVFVAYLLAGLGLSKVIQSIPGFSTWGRWVYLVTGALCMVLAALTIRDVVRARQGQPTEMTLKLPASLRKRINKVIREGAQMRAFVPIAFVTGLIVSVIELACTGQIYAPTIIMMLSVPEMASRAFLFLLIYCLAFIIPLVVVFVLSYFGTTSEQLGQFLGKHTATVKALTAALFVALSLWMAWTVAPLFGLNAPWNWILLLIVLAAIALGVILTRPWVKPVPKAKRRPAPQKRRSRA
jgi:hypothetical protein